MLRLPWNLVCSTNKVSCGIFFLPESECRTSTAHLRLFLCKQFLFLTLEFCIDLGTTRRFIAMGAGRGERVSHGVGWVWLVVASRGSGKAICYGTLVSDLKDGQRKGRRREDRKKNADLGSISWCE